MTELNNPMDPVSAFPAPTFIDSWGMYDESILKLEAVEFGEGCLYSLFVEGRYYFMTCFLIS